MRFTMLKKIGTEKYRKSKHCVCKEQRISSMRKETVALMEKVRAKAMAAQTVHQFRRVYPRRPRFVST